MGPDSEGFAGPGPVAGPGAGPPMMSPGPNGQPPMGGYNARYVSFDLRLAECLADWKAGNATS
jgi:hypothetical protein